VAPTGHWSLVTGHDSSGMTPPTERYLDLARPGRNAWWRYILGALIISGSWLGLGLVPYALVVRAGIFDSRLDFIAINCSIFVMLGGLAVTMKWLHRRPLLSLITPAPRIDWRRMRRGALAWFAIAAVLSLIEFLLFRERFYLSFDAVRFAPFLLLVLLLTPLQAATEELVFRGYAMQAFAQLTRSPAMIAILSSVVFTAPHLLNPEVQRHGVLLMAANYFAIGMLLATIALRDGRLELAIGLHAANNMFLALVVNYEESALMTESIFTSRELDPYFSLMALIAGALAFHWWVFRSAAAGSVTRASHRGDDLHQRDLR
jgi:membrane protease YdiL (CAAX protease family)